MRPGLRGVFRRPMRLILPLPSRVVFEQLTRRPHLRRGVAIAAASGFGALLLMANDAHLRLGVPLGAACVGACAWGIIDLAGAFEGSTDPPRSRVPAASLVRPCAIALAAWLATLFCVWAAVQGVAPQWLAGGLLTGTFLGGVASLFACGVALGPLREDETGNPRPLHKRHGFWLLVAMAVLYLPALGNGSLVDPWETHYGEVAREVIARDDWISTWWSWEGFFYSKPVLGIWIQAIAMATLGVDVRPDRMLSGLHGAFAHPEWAVRLPFALFAMGGTYLLYKGVARWCGRRAALLGALILATSPHWFFLAHQSMTDMPFIASLAGAIGLVLLAAHEDDATQVVGYEVSFGRRTVRLGAWHAVVGAVVVVALAQIAYLITRNVELVLHATGPHGFRWHADEVMAGSGLGNCNQPGDPLCSSRPPVSGFEPWMQALLWSCLLAAFVVVSLREQRTKRLLYLGAWVLAALSTMAKGPGGIAIPLACVGAWIGLTGRWREIPRASIAPGLLALAVMVGPWVVAMVVRHGSAFTDELFFHDIYNRAFDHVHDTNAGVDTSLVYYVQQLGYGLFPWTALVPLALVSCFGRPEKDQAGEASLLLFCWFAVTFTLFAAMGTKFHHYIAPATAPLAMLVGVALDACFDRPGRDGEGDPDGHQRLMRAAACVGGALLLLLVTRDLLEGQGRLMQLFTYRYDRPWPRSLDVKTPLTIAGVLASVVAVALAVPRLRPVAARASVVLAMIWAGWGLDVYLPRASPHWGQRSVIEAYYANRVGPEEPIVAYRLNWKGENFYTGNRIPQFGTPTVPPNTPTFLNWVHERKAGGTKVMFFATERSQLTGLKNELAHTNVRELTTSDDSSQFVVVRAEL